MKTIEKTHESVCTIKKYIKNHTITGIVTETDALWDKETDGEIPNDLKDRTIQEIIGTTVVVY